MYYYYEIRVSYGNDLSATSWLVLTVGAFRRIPNLTQFRCHGQTGHQKKTGNGHGTNWITCSRARPGAEGVGGNVEMPGEVWYRQGCGNAAAPPAGGGGGT